MTTLKLRTAQDRAKPKLQALENALAAGRGGGMNIASEVAALAADVFPDRPVEEAIDELLGDDYPRLRMAVDAASTSKSLENSAYLADSRGARSADRGSWCDAAYSQAVAPLISRLVEHDGLTPDAALEVVNKLPRFYDQLVLAKRTAGSGISLAEIAARHFVPLREHVGALLVRVAKSSGSFASAVRMATWQPPDAA